MSWICLLLVLTTLVILIVKRFTQENLRVIVDGQSSILFEADNINAEEAIVIGESQVKSAITERLESNHITVKNISSKILKANSLEGVKMKISTKFYTKKHIGKVRVDAATCLENVESKTQFATCNYVNKTDNCIVFGKFQ